MRSRREAGSSRGELFETSITRMNISHSEGEVTFILYFFLAEDRVCVREDRDRTSRIPEIVGYRYGAIVYSYGWARLFFERGSGDSPRGGLARLWDWRRTVLSKISAADRIDRSARSGEFDCEFDYLPLLLLSIPLTGRYRQWQAKIDEDVQ